MNDGGETSGAVGEESSPHFRPDLMRCACWVFAFSLLCVLFSARVLYADGSLEFVRVLESKSFFEMVRTRQFASNLFELPLVTAIQLGVTDLQLLRLAFGVGCLLPWPIALAFCHRLSPKHFWIAAVGCAAGYLNTAFVAVGEHIVAHAFFWPAVFALLFVRPLTRLAAAVLFGSAAIMVYSYESMLFLGPALALLALWRAGSGLEKKWARVVLIISAMLFIAGAWVACLGVFWPETPSNFGSFKARLKGQLDHPGWTVGWSFAWLTLLALLWVPQKISRFIPHRFFYAGVGYAFVPAIWYGWWLSLPRFAIIAAVLFLALVCVLPEFLRLLQGRAGHWLLAGVIVMWSAWPVLAPRALNPMDQHYARFMNLVVPFGLLPIAVLLAWKPDWFAAQHRTVVKFTAIFLLAQSLWHIAATWQWHGYIGMWRGVQASRMGPIKVSGTILTLNRSAGGQALRFDWWWADPCLSIALSLDGKINSLIVPHSKPDWQPFDPFNSNELPRLQQYGIDYSGYISALAGNTNRPPEVR